MSPKYESDSDRDEVEELAEKFEEVNIDITKLTPLSPEVISKQVGFFVFKV